MFYAPASKLKILLLKNRMFLFFKDFFASDAHLSLSVIDYQLSLLW
jgi:hypothetical protein